MKRLGLVLGCIFLVSLLFGDSNLVRQESSKYFVVDSVSISSHTVSSSTVITLADMARVGVSRKFAIDGACTGTVYFQYNGSTTTVSSIGMPMEENGKLYEENNYYSNIYFQTDTSTATLRVIEITRK